MPRRLAIAGAEARFRDVAPAADQYAAATALYFMLTGKLVYDFPKRPELQIAMILEEDVVPIQERRGDIPDRLARVIQRGLARDVKRRYGDVGAMGNDLLK